MSDTTLHIIPHGCAHFIHINLMSCRVLSHTMYIFKICISLLSSFVLNILRKGHVIFTIDNEERGLSLPTSSHFPVSLSSLRQIMRSFRIILIFYYTMSECVVLEKLWRKTRCGFIILLPHFFLSKNLLTYAFCFFFLFVLNPGS